MGRQVGFLVPDQGFWAVLEIILGKSVIDLLMDHKLELGYRTIERVVVFGAELIEGDEYQKA